MFSSKFHTFFAVTFKRMVGDHDHPAIAVVLFDVIKNINTAFARQVNIKHGNLRIQLINKNSCVLIIRGRMELCDIKILRKDREHPFNIANIIVNNENQRFQCLLIEWQINDDNIMGL